MIYDTCALEAMPSTSLGATGTLTTWISGLLQLMQTKRTLHTYASLLEDCHFIRVHKSYVVNLEHIKEYIHGDGGSVVLTGNKMVEVSRRKRDILLDKMRQHFRY